jgi:hypothetical protein
MNLFIEVEKMLELDCDYEEIIAFIQAARPGYTLADCEEVIMDCEMKLAVRYKDMEDYEYMDGDHASALASAGWGTDEDYGYASDDY